MSDSTVAQEEVEATSTLVYTRDNERRLEELRQRHTNAPSSLSDEEKVELAILQSKCDVFVAEGIRRLEAGVTPAAAAAAASSSAGSVSGSMATVLDVVGGAFSATASAVTTAATGTIPLVTETAGTVGRAAYFWGSLIGTAVPAVAKMAGLTSQFDHWNFITDRLILGAMPVVTQVGNSGNHLHQLHQQLEERKQSLGMVAACLHEEEMRGFGLALVSFAREEDWIGVFGKSLKYCYLPMPDGTAATSMESVRTAVDLLHECLDVQKQCAYIHCKAGKGRSWMLTMCYLATYGGRSFENAEALVRMSRHQVNPSSSQREFARDFCKKFHADEEAKRLLGGEYNVDAD